MFPFFIFDEQKKIPTRISKRMFVLLLLMLTGIGMLIVFFNWLAFS
jgi:hypothetical protein